ncbi:MAG: VIT1/CCC1 transporter family protein [Paludibacteraceae bacterium]|nr:VIT1/CCC1 transporter family protein [Paludibacteraceae bacterium]
MDPKVKKIVLAVQRAEETEHLVYMRLAELTKDENNAEILRKIGIQEKGHARFWEKISGVEVKPDMWRVFRVVWLARILGLTFVLKLMEKREGTGSAVYTKLAEYFPESKKFAEEELVHEKQLLNMLDEESLQYVGSIVLGLNDALVELTGALAGFTLALSDNRIISLVGLVTGISAALSMAASDYLSSKADGESTAGKSALYTGVAYFITVILLITPFLLLDNQFIALGITLSTAVLIIFLFNYYISVAKDLNFKARFLEMTIISLGVAAFSFLVGYALKYLLGVDV